MTQTTKINYAKIIADIDSNDMRQQLEEGQVVILSDDGEMCAPLSAISNVIPYIPIGEDEVEEFDLDDVVAEYLGGDDESRDVLVQIDEDVIDLCAKFADEDESRILALCQLLDIHPSEVSETRMDVYGEGQGFDAGGAEYVVCLEDEADSAWDAALESYLDECVLPELPDTAQQYFDRDAWKRDAQHDGRGHALNPYDGGEEEERVGDEYFLIYRVN